MLRNIAMVLYLAGYMICALPGLIHARLLRGNPARYEAFCRKKIVRFAKRCLKRTGAEVELRGLENIPREATLTVFNHQSYMDIFILIAEIPNTQAMIAKKELAKIPLLSSWMRAGNCIFIDRSSPRDGLRCINEAAELVKHGVNVSVAPEGTRSKGGPMHEFKSGTFKIAFKSEAPVLPIAINGAHKLYEGNGNRLKPAKVIVTVLPPIPTKGLSREEQKALPALVQEKIKNVIQSQGETV